MSERRHSGLDVIGVALGVLFAAGLGLYSFIRATSTPLHRNPQAVPSVPKAPPFS
jgi:ABC-type nitrate/sulfonate/bicarbonate transport system permease component